MLALVDSFQRTLRFAYQGDLLASVSGPSGRIYRYEYEAPSSFASPGMRLLWKQRNDGTDLGAASLAFLNGARQNPHLVACSVRSGSR